MVKAAVKVPKPSIQTARLLLVGTTQTSPWCGCYIIGKLSSIAIFNKFSEVELNLFSNTL